MGKKYRLKYLPLFEHDMDYILYYISIELSNPVAARKLLDDVEEAIQKRLQAPLSFEPFHSKRERQYPYYRIYVNNYTVFYVVIDDVMEVRRIRYSASDYAESL
jgi:plasmid stabilization system protein ParE